MKKLLNILSSTIIIASTAATVIACSTEMATNTYKDSELGSIKDKSLLRYIEASSSVAKNFIGARHENANYSAATFSGIFGRYSAPLLAPNGEKIDLDREMTSLRQLNPNIRNRDPLNDATRVSESYFEFTNKFKGEGYDPNNTAWALYDTGPVANTAIAPGNSIARDWVIHKEDDTRFSQRHDGASYLSSHFLQKYNADDSPIYNKDREQYNLNFKKEFEDKSKSLTFGKNMGEAERGSYNLLGTGVLDNFKVGLDAFGRGTEEFTLAALSAVLPILNVGKTTERYARDFYLIFSLLLNLSKTDWFDGKKLINDEGVLANSSINFDETTEDLERELYDVIENLNGKLTDHFDADAKLLPEDQKGFPLDGTVPEVKEAFREIRKMELIFTKLIDNSPNFSIKKFNQVMSAPLSGLLEIIVPIVGDSVSLQIQSLLATLKEVFSVGMFPAYELANFIGDIAKLFTINTSDSTFVVEDNNEMYEKINSVYNFADGKTEEELEKQGYTTDITEINKSWTSPQGKYYKTIMQAYGLQSEEQEQYDEDSIFKWIWNMQYPGEDGNNSGGYDLIQALFNDANNPFTRVATEANESITNNWIDKVFLDKNWDISADGIGVNGQKLGWVDKDKKALVYQLDYYGPKDGTVDLEMHKTKLDYLKDGEEYPTDIPEQIKNLTIDEQLKYDGLGNSYLSNSNEIKYSYIVRFEEVEYADSAILPAWKFTDFKWFYNNNRYY
ncbi:lipoprotein [Spiroplasma endosymbiont of Anurida maritima]|uniref:lipoprotein n=1 Tax=Spiroplasma endosymbiont of Anurida maritima TaxID=2967972 RepID=UPI0036D33F42